MPGRTSNLTKDPLYRELLAIGGKEKTIRPDALHGYKNLLRCVEVRRRAGPHADEDRLALCASEALKAAIANIVSATTREIAEAALCVKEDFEGLRVSERVNELPGISDKQYKYHRRLAFREIIRFLKKSVMVNTDEKSTDQKGVGVVSLELYYLEGNPETPSALTALAARAARLHYASLACMFACEFDENEHLNDSRSYGWDGDACRLPLGEYVFETYVALIYLSRFIEIIQESHQYLPKHAQDLVVSLFQRIADSPAGPENITEDQARNLFADQLTIETYPRMRGLFVLGDITRDVYFKKWYNWYHYERPEDKEAFLSVATPLASASGVIPLVLARHTSFDAPVYSQARLLAHKALANYYEFDEWAPLFGGKSLRYHADAYFDSESPALTNQVLS